MDKPKTDGKFCYEKKVLKLHIPQHYIQQTRQDVDQSNTMASIH